MIEQEKKKTAAGRFDFYHCRDVGKRYFISGERVDIMHEKRIPRRLFYHAVRHVEREAEGERNTSESSACLFS